MTKTCYALIAAIAFCAAPAFGAPPKKDDCPCAGKCKCAADECPDCLKAKYPGKTIHISPDGTVNALCADGVYRAIPGAVKVKGVGTPAVGCVNGSCGAVPAFLPPSITGSSCPNGNCPAPSRGFFRR